MLLPTLDLSFTIRVHGPVPDLPFLGPTVRGLLGYGLRQTCCGHEARADGACSLGDNCTYSYLFEGPLQLRSRQKRLTIDAFPQPFLPLVTPPSDGPGGGAAATASAPSTAPSQEISFGIRLIGAACELSQAVIDAVIAREPFGFGARSFGYTVLRVAQRARTQPSPWPSEQDRGRSAAMEPMSVTAATHRMPSILRFHFRTPLSLGLRMSEGIHLGAELVDAAARRLWLLEQAYGDGAPDRSIPRAADPREFTTMATQLAPWEFTRRSTRHGRVVRLSGLLGNTAIEGPWHRHGALLGAMLHYGIGRSTTFGFGRVEIEAADAALHRVSRREAPEVSPASPARRTSSAAHSGSFARATGVPRWVRLRGNAPPAPRSDESSSPRLSRVHHGQ